MKLSDQPDIIFYVDNKLRNLALIASEKLGPIFTNLGRKNVPKTKNSPERWIFKRLPTELKEFVNWGGVYKNLP